MKLETGRLILRPLKNSDVGAIVKNISNINVSKWLLVVPHPYTEKDALWWINKTLKDWGEKDLTEYNFGIELKSVGEIIGGIGLDQIDKFQGIGSVGYWLGQEYWRKGYGSEALERVLDFAFNELKLRRVNAEIFAGNPSSGKLLEKFGAKKEGIQRRANICKADNKVKDAFIYGLLQEEYKK